MKYVGLIETRYEVEADNEEEAEAKIIAKLVEEAMQGEANIIIWEDSNERSG